jgi:hypothetical protein
VVGLIAWVVLPLAIILREPVAVKYETMSDFNMSDRSWWNLLSFFCLLHNKTVS